MEAQKQEVLDQLTKAWSKDAISMDEYEVFVERVHQARGMEELHRLRSEAGLITPASFESNSQDRYEPGNTRQDKKQEAVAPQRSSLPTRERVQNSSCLLSEKNYRGDWLEAEIVTDSTILGSTVYDFRDCSFPSYEIRLEVMTVLGSVEVIVPENLAVRMEASAVLGEAELHKSVRRKPRDGDFELIISGSVMLGSVSVKCK